MKIRKAFAALLCVAAIGAPRARALQATPASSLSDTAITTKFDVNGLSVILRRNTANEVVVANLYLLGGTRQLTEQTAGIEALILAASERGTKRFPGAAARQKTANLGSSIGVEAGDDWSAMGLRAIRATFDSTWERCDRRTVQRSPESMRTPLHPGRSLHPPQGDVADHLTRST